MTDSNVLDAVQVGAWKTGFDHRSGQAVLICEFADRGPVVLMIPLAEVTKIGRALLALNDPGQSSPARPN